MGTDEVIRKTLALAQSQLLNYKSMASKPHHGSSQSAGRSATSGAAIQQSAKSQQSSAA